MTTEATTDGTATAEPPDPARLAALAPEERRRTLDRYIRDEIGRLLGIAADRVDTTGRTMYSLGIGSIAGLELQCRLEAALHVTVDLQRLLRANSAAELIDCLAGQLGPDGAHQRSAVPA
ncbi:acyl carrier protein [Streptomyces lutosisoli]|uniref:Acyl carrier protein n=1 Tax=Streptomyces lutosisoli TaxID=2665721 RepID=A0ABW2VIT5_9ACTN